MCSNLKLGIETELLLKRSFVPRRDEESHVITLASKTPQLRYHYGWH